ncbi:hypothetical protein [Lactobacillus helveticus]|uniref:Transcriptional regulator n=2 Tax=Lactobacillus helveticus TaxID=1587 RepID=U4QIF8_LACHE|nr:hypothetical protein [Lactobacillus helveticus]ALI52569.1 hypothetical protein ALV80_05485 [Lactobacillus helveticus]CDI43076.1 Transcriptional regulator [Lactobacillus helveticus CIRM-BIA 953]
MKQTSCCKEGDSIKNLIKMKRKAAGLTQREVSERVALKIIRLILLKEAKTLTKRSPVIEQSLLTKLRLESKTQTTISPV